MRDYDCYYYLPIVTTLAQAAASTHPALDPGTDRESMLTYWQGPLYQKMTAIWIDKGWGLAGPPF